MRHLPLERIEQELFLDPTVVTKIQHNYSIEPHITGLDLRNAVLTALGQREINPLSATWSNAEVFEAAVKAIGSNSQVWTRFLARYGELTEELVGFEPSSVVSRCKELGFQEYSKRLRRFFSGQTSARSTNEALIHFAHTLAEQPNYFSGLQSAYSYYLDRFAIELFGRGRRSAATLATALLLGNRDYQPRAEEAQLAIRKIPGMGFVLACEFLRTLGFTGFKPDRHVMQMLAKWYSAAEQAELIDKQFTAFEAQFGRVLASDKNTLRMGLLGAAVTPQAVPINEADQLVWLYRAILGGRRAT